MADGSVTTSAGFITGSGVDGRVPYFDGTNSITSEAGFIYDASTNRLGVNTSVPNATIGADAALNSGYGLLIKTGASNYNGIGIAIDSTYGNTIETAKLGTASARNLTLLNQSGFVSLTESGAFGVGILTPNNGIDIYNSTQSQLWLHNAASGLTATDGVRLALFNNLSANLRNFDGGLSLTAEGDFSIITIGAENLRVNSANGFIGIGNPASLTSLLTVNGSITQSVTSALLKSNASGTLVAAVAGTDYVTPSGLSGYVPTSRTITINGTSQSLVADSSYTVGTLRGNGVSGRIPFYDGTQTFSNSSNFIWDDVNGYLGVNNTPQIPLDVLGAGFNVSGTNMNIVARFTKDKSSTFKGIGLGYDTSSQTGIIYADTATTSIPSNIAFWTLGSGVYTEKMRITGAGNVGIGTSTINGSTNYRMLRINGTNGGEFTIAANEIDRGYIYASSGDFSVLSLGAVPLILGTNGSERMRITNGGNVGIGTSSPDIFSRGDARIVGISASGASDNMSLQLNAGASGGRGAQIYMGQGGTRHFTISSNVSESTLGTTSNTPLRFTINDAERTRITSGGYLKASNTGTYQDSSGTYHELRSNSSQTLLASNTRNASGDLLFNCKLGANADNTSSYFMVGETGGANRIIIFGNGNIQNTYNSYGQLSDIKLKENIVDATPKLDDLMKVRVVNYNLIGNEVKQIGVIAQELEQVFAGLVDEHIDRDSEENDLGTTTKSVKYSVFVPMLIKAIQEQQAQIEELKKIVALESK
jgi:hypothetical protein